MKEKSRPNSPFLQMEQAQQLLDLGHRQEALALALDALLQELYHLREAIVILKRLSQSPPQAPGIEPSPRPSPQVPGEKPRVVH